ncbi:MAG: winged helix-turn-helix transcriptional regulator [Candidatus Korarchaeota archaeon]|nr:winged helix-turn-helix transcriptional regulator [Candidatus Korarchaeota archaeon]NIU81916.1 helix-turn-helix domain-containing protein [Candidatus Thorarchaeota archaeon]NIW12374.1 helix-turn-helix domain-containing protein [Candidatus Thorarchaeota archaeon]NIW51166.1 helix-turn-helix domain-containing protein [Candidatus Korarchaeota archaeon]
MKKEKKEDALEKLTEKVNKLTEEIKHIKKDVKKERVPATNLGRIIGDTVKHTMSIMEELPQTIEKSLENIRIPEAAFQIHLDRGKEELKRKKEEIRAQAEELKARAKDMAQRIKQEVWKNLQRELTRQGFNKNEIKRELQGETDEALREAEEKASKISKKIDAAVEKSVAKTSREFEENIKKAVEQFDAGNTADILSTLSSPERLEILRFLNKGGRYYTEIGEKVELGPSSLKFHLGKLKSEKLVEQERSRGKYFITEKGKSAIRLAAYLGRILQPTRETFKGENLNKESSSDSSE